jgi:hypothetical protein
MRVELMIPNTIMAGKEKVASRLTHIEEKLMRLVLQPHTWKKVSWAQSRARYANMIIGDIDRAQSMLCEIGVSFDGGKHGHCSP